METVKIENQLMDIQVLPRGKKEKTLDFCLTVAAFIL